MSIFTGTLAVSFLVVGMPHLLPCPVPHRAYADGDMPDELKRRRRRRKVVNSQTGNMEEVLVEPGRECPVPKPGGLVGQVLGFEKREGRMPEVTIERVSDRRRRPSGN
jgi:cytochrome c oxidase assembly factor 2